MTSNKYFAQRIYNREFNYLRRQAKEENTDLSLLLSIFVPNELMPFWRFSSYRKTTPPDTSKMKQRERERCLKEWYRPFFYEWLINDQLWDLTDRGFKTLKKQIKNARETHKITQPKSNAKKDLIKKRRDEYFASGKFSPGNERGLPKIIAEDLGYKYNYVQDYIKLLRRNENPK